MKSMTELAGGELCLPQQPHNQVGAARRRSFFRLQCRYLPHVEGLAIYNSLVLASHGHIICLLQMLFDDKAHEGIVRRMSWKWKRTGHGIHRRFATQDKIELRLWYNYFILLNVVNLYVARLNQNTIWRCLWWRQFMFLSNLDSDK